MRFFSFLLSLSVVTLAFAATCPEDGLWPVSEGGIDIVVNCPQGTYGRMSRYCMMTKNGTAEWQEAKMESCLPLTPEPGMAFIDMIYNVSQSRARFIEYRPSGFADAISFVYRVNKTAVSVHRIAEEVDMHSSVQVRVTLPVDEASKLYDEIMLSDRADGIAQFFQDNNNDRRRYQILTLKGNLHCDITYIGTPELTVNEIPPENPIWVYMKTHMLWIVICCVELVVLIILAVMKGGKKESIADYPPLV